MKDKLYKIREIFQVYSKHRRHRKTMQKKGGHGKQQNWLNAESEQKSSRDLVSYTSRDRALQNLETGGI